MRVSRLEVFGFKSFMNRLMLPLEGGITGVVGPNGCGKSNIVDALRWVLGETRASNLRGELLEDVIFNGTDKFRPLGLAEVSITLRSRGDNFFSDLLTPLDVLRLETGSLMASSAVASEPVPSSLSSDAAPAEDASSTESNSEESAAAPKSVGLKVIEGFKGKEIPAQVDGETVSQQQTDQPAEQANAEAQEEELNEQPHAVAPAILNRFAWLKATSEVQITRRLYRSGESEFFLNRVPCKLKDIKDLLRAVGLGPRSYTIVAQGEVGRIVSSRPEERRAIIEEAAGVLGIKERISAAKRRLEETRGNLTRLDDVISEVTRQVNSLKRQASRAEARAELKSRLHHLDNVLLLERLARFDASITQLQTRLAELQEKERTSSDQVATRRAEEESARNQLTEVEAHGDALRLEVDQIKEEIHRRKRLLFEQESRLNELKGVIALKREESSTNQERAEGLKARRGQLEQERAEAQREFDSVSAEVASLEKGNDDELRQSNIALHSSREALRSAEQKFRAARENFLRSQTRLSEVEKHIVASSPLTQIQRTLGERSPLTEALKRSSRPLSDALRVPADLTTAVRAVLGERAGFLISADPFELAHIASQGDLATKKNGFCLGIMRASAEEGQTTLQTEHAPIGTATVIPLLSRVEVAAWGQGAAQELLGDVLVADSAQEATAFFASARDEQGCPVRRPETVVTRKGEMFTADSFFIFNHEGGVLELKVRSEQLQTELQSFEAEVTRLSQERDAASAAVEAAELRNKQALAESQARQAAVRALLNRQGNARGRLDATERMLRQTVNDAERAELAVKGCVTKIEECESALAGVVAKIAEMKAADTSDAEAKLQALTEQYRALDGKRSALRSAVSSAANVTAELQLGLEFTRREISRAELEQQKLSLEKQNIADNFVQLYGQEAFAAAAEQKAAESLPSDTFNEFERESAAIRARIVREGDVDPTTIEQFRTDNERLQDLLRQHTDLSSAVSTLEETVVSLEKASVERFIETFNAVARHFELLIPRLFGGGRGELVLTAPETPLQSGVEILVRPPGKKPKSIELLSGGEKALCATAMIFAMFLVRPSPLCVLDEVDAPLDEANLVRLLTLIKEMSQKTQFLMITHNKQSMSTADNLVGVTMQDPGSTQILTVSLQEAMNHTQGPDKDSQAHAG